MADEHQDETGSPVPGGEGRRDLRAIAAATLDRLPELIEAFVTQVVTLPGYANGEVGDDELRSGAGASIELLIRHIADLPLDQRLRDASGEIGRARMDAGVPLESLMQAVRLDFRLVWSALSDEIQPSEMAVLIAGGADVWEAVEQHANAVLIGYQARLAEITRAIEDERREWFARLLATDGQRAETVKRAAHVLGFVPERRFVVAVARRGESALARVRADVLGRGAPCHLHTQAESDTLLFQLPNGAGDAPQQRWFAGAACVVSSPFEGLAAAPRHIRLAQACRRALGELNGPRLVRDAWLELAAASIGEFRRDLVRDLLSPLRGLTAADRERIVEAVHTVLETGGVPAAAARLYCHRNTIFNRLNRFRALTGLDPSSPRDAALIKLALLCLEAAD
ncbi:helix-turn-helix domain-containing protein [Nonomuraea sp. NPDC049637]|uniref:PucR family transcriptional regulator n=1 Tax=Nonomuraea sp. NPDC049637 TaxID=3154356 RepID=UPI0034130645